MVFDFQDIISRRLSGRYIASLVGSTELGFTPDEIGFREHRAVYTAHLWHQQKWDDLQEFCTDPNDILRLLVQLTGGDVSLAEKVTFPKLKRAQRRRILGLLEKVGVGRFAEGQLVKYRGLWLALERSLHSGEHRRLFPKACGLLDRLRLGELQPQFRNLEQAYTSGSSALVLAELQKHPAGVSLRRFCQTLSLSHTEDENLILETLMPRVRRAALKDQLILASVLERDGLATEALILTKRGNTRAIKRDPNSFSSDYRARALRSVQDAIESTFHKRFGPDSWRGKRIFIDPKLKNWTVPLSLRSASDSLTVMGRGTRVPMGQEAVLRMYVYWKQNFQTTDLDLTALTFNDGFECTGFVSWTNTKRVGMVYSGDIQSAPFGAAEFIDADVDMLRAQGHRYLSMLVYRYCGEYFSSMECLCGWMMRDKVDSNYQTFDIGTVSQKMLISGEARYAMPALFDLEKREVVWLDLKVFGLDGFNRAENSWQNLERLVRLGVNMQSWKLSLFDLAELHICHRQGVRTQNSQEADIHFTEDRSGDYHPGNWSKILSELL